MNFFLVFIYLQAFKVLTSQVQNWDMKKMKGWKRPPELCSSFAQNCCFPLCVFFFITSAWVTLVCLLKEWQTMNSLPFKVCQAKHGAKGNGVTALTVFKSDEFFLHNIDRGHDNLSYYISGHSEITLTLHCSAKRWVIKCCSYPSNCFFSHNFQFLHNRIKTRMEVHFYII